MEVHGIRIQIGSEGPQGEMTAVDHRTVMHILKDLDPAVLGKHQPDHAHDNGNPMSALSLTFAIRSA